MSALVVERILAWMRAAKARIQKRRWRATGLRFPQKPSKPSKPEAKDQRKRERDSGFIVAPPPPIVSNEHLQGKKTAYKFETEWWEGTFRGPYKGKNPKYNGLFNVCFDRRNWYYLNLSLDTYGCDKDWVVIANNNK